MRLWFADRLLVVSLVGLAACDEVSFPVLGDEEFAASLAGANEVPAVTTNASGNAAFALVDDTLLIYRLDVAAIDTPTVAHIHEGAAGTPGGIIVTLYAGPTRNTVGYTGPLGIGQLRAAQLTLLPAGYGATPQARMAELIARMRAGTVYVNVHSRRNPAGELRGQVGLR